MTNPVSLLSEYVRIDTSGIPTYGLMPVLPPRAEHGKIHGVDERIPLAGIAEMAEIVYALVERWNTAR